MSRVTSITMAVAALGWLCPAVAEDFQGSTHTLAYEDPPIAYNAQTPNDRVAKLQARIASGEVKLKWDEQFGWLPALLEVPGVDGHGPDLEQMTKLRKLYAKARKQGGRRRGTSARPRAARGTRG